MTATPGFPVHVEACGCTWRAEYWTHGCAHHPEHEPRHAPTDECSGEPVMYASQCVECGVRLCSCELTYGHDCEVS